MKRLYSRNYFTMNYILRILLITFILFMFGCIEVEVKHPIIIKLAEKTTCKSKPAVVAIIDTGLYLSKKTVQANLCKFGHKNFTEDMDTIHFPGINDSVPLDHHGHGTNIAGIIQNNAGNANYCLLILKYYSPKAKLNDNLNNTIKAIEYATDLGVKYINYSGGGTEFSLQEQRSVKKFLDNGGTLIAAAGNEKSDLEKNPYYPALDDPRVISVGNIDMNRAIAYSSNYGKLVKAWEIGTEVEGFGLLMSGTSQASAVHMGKLLKNNELCLK